VPEVCPKAARQRETAVMETRCPCSLDDVDVYDLVMFELLHVTIDHQ
jgi:hypothetical protein